MASVTHESKETPQIAHMEGGLQNDDDFLDVKAVSSGQAGTDEYALAYPVSLLSIWLTWTFRYGHPLVVFDPVEERRLVYKIDICIIPTVALLYLFCFIDRANIGKQP